MASVYSIEEARAKLGDLVSAARAGQTIIITRNGKPAAQLIAIVAQGGITMRRLTTDRDAKAQIVAAIEGSGESGADGYDLDAIFHEAYEWRIDRDVAGNELLNTGGFEQAVDGDAFWAIVAKHEQP